MTSIAALRGGPFHGERRKIAELPEEVTHVDLPSTLQYVAHNSSDMQRRLHAPCFPTALHFDFETRRMPGYGFKADVMPGGHFLYWLRGHQGRVGLYVCEHPGMTPADMHRRAHFGREPQRPPRQRVLRSTDSQPAVW